MGEYYVNRACGHTELMRLPDSHAARARKSAALSRRVCTRCLIEAQERVDSLPPLHGTPKQVAWAAQIRYERMRAWRADAPADVLAAVKGQLSARWWIEHRITSIELIQRELAYAAEPVSGW